MMDKIIFFIAQQP